MKVVLSTSPHVRHPVVLQREFAPGPSVVYTFSPVGLLALSSALRSCLGIEPTLFDLNRQIRDGVIQLNSELYRNTAEAICELNPTVIGFMTECDSYHHVLQIASMAKRLLPECHIVLGGPHATAVAFQTMRKCEYVDSIVLGEGERSFPALIEALSESRGGTITGTLRRTRAGEILDGGNPPLVDDLDSLPPPAYDLYQPDSGEEIFIEAGRGCPFQCSFCSTAPFWRRRHRVKSPGRILKEIKIVQRLYGTGRVHFTHDLLTTDRLWLKSVCLELIEANTPVLWTCSARTDTVDEELLALMAEAGCNAIYFGIESGSQRILHEIKKDIPLAHSLQILRVCRRHGITPNAGFIAGFPSEDEISLKETFDAYSKALQLGCRPTHIFGFCPFAQSSIYPTLENMECTGHFVDLPLGASADEANRTLISQDPELYGSYFRPVLPTLRNLMSAVDEFSCLVEAALIPTLLLAQAEGGLMKVYERWVGWITARNSAHGTPQFRLRYGSPRSYCDFLVDQLEKHPSLDGYAVQLAKVLQISAQISAEWETSTPTTIGGHRSVPMPEAITSVDHNDRLVLGSVLAKVMLDFDISHLLTASPEDLTPPARRPCYLVWHAHSVGKVRLVEVDSFLFSVLENLKFAPHTAADLMRKWRISPHREGVATNDSEHILKVLTEATEAGLISIDEN